MQDILVELLVASRGNLHHTILRKICFDACDEISRLRNAIKETLEENAHLADGDNCTLIKLKHAIDKE